MSAARPRNDSVNSRFNAPRETAFGIQPHLGVEGGSVSKEEPMPKPEDDTKTSAPDPKAAGASKSSPDGGDGAKGTNGRAANEAEGKSAAGGATSTGSSGSQQKSAAGADEGGKAGAQ